MGFGCLDTRGATSHSIWVTVPCHIAAYNMPPMQQGGIHVRVAPCADGERRLTIVDESQNKIDTVKPNIAREQGQNKEGLKSTKATELSQNGQTKRSMPRKAGMSKRASELSRKRFEASQPAWSVPFDLQRCMQMVSQLDGSTDVQAVAALELEEAFASLAFDVQGCRVAQEALELGWQDVKVKLALKLRGHIMEAIDSPYANYVVQKIIEDLPSWNVQFVVDELAGSVVRVARHPYGVRVLCRLLEHCPPAMIEELVFKLTEKVNHLCRHKFGTYIVHHILEYGTTEQRGVVIKTLADDVLKLAGNRLGSELLLRVLSNPGLVEGSELLATLVEVRGSLQLAPNRHKCSVLRALLRLRGNELEDVRLFLARSKS